MSRAVRLAVLRARNDTSLPTISDSACREMIFNNSQRTAVFQFWQDNTNGYLQLGGSDLLPWVDVSLSNADARNSEAQKAYDATVAAGHDLSGYDGFVVLVYPGTVTVPNPRASQLGQPATLTTGLDGGTGSVANQSAAVLPVMTCDMTFMCHEVGHVLGFDHTWGVPNNGVDWNGTGAQSDEYGDPFDIMSSAAFGSRWEGTGTQYGGSPAYAGPVVAGWPNSNAFTMGPAPARANVALFTPDAFTTQTRAVVPWPGANQPRTARVWAAAQVNLPTLIQLDPPTEGTGGQRRILIELRSATGWDQGLDTSGGDLARQGIVVHELANAANGGLVRCWYRGQIDLPLAGDADLTLIDVPLTVRVTACAEDLSWADIGLVVTDEHALSLEDSGQDIEVGAQNVTVTHTHCGDLQTGTYWLDRLATLTPISYGYGGAGTPGVRSPEITWTIGGTAVTGSGSVDLEVSGRSVTITTTVDVDGRLTLRSRSADGAYSVPVQCTATEHDGSAATSASYTFAPIGSYTGLHQPDWIKVQICLRRLVNIVKVRPRDLLIPPGPDPYLDGRTNRENLQRLEKVAQQLDTIDRTAAAQLRGLAQLRYGVGAPKVALTPGRISSPIR